MSWDLRNDLGLLSTILTGNDIDLDTSSNNHAISSFIHDLLKCEDTVTRSSPGDDKHAAGGGSVLGATIKWIHVVPSLQGISQSFQLEDVETLKTLLHNTIYLWYV